MHERHYSVFIIHGHWGKGNFDLFAFDIGPWLCDWHIFRLTGSARHTVKQNLKIAVDSLCCVCMQARVLQDQTMFSSSSSRLVEEGRHASSDQGPR